MVFISHDLYTGFLAPSQVVIGRISEPSTISLGVVASDSHGIFVHSGSLQRLQGDHCIVQKNQEKRRCFWLNRKGKGKENKDKNDGNGEEHGYFLSENPTCFIWKISIKWQQNLQS